MWLLNQRVYRFGELRKAIPGITQHMLTAQLREFGADGLVSRTVFAEVLPRVEYEITAKARGLGPTMEALTAWWHEYGKTIPVRTTTRTGGIDQLGTYAGGNALRGGRWSSDHRRGSRAVLALISIEPGETLLVAGAAGGVGTAVIQLTRYRNVTVVGTASEAKHDYLRQFGAIPTTYGPGLVSRVRELAPDGVDAALDLAGAGVIPDLIEIVKDAKRVLSIADIDAPTYGAQATTSQVDHPAAALSDAARRYAEGAFSLPIERMFSLDNVAEAHELSATGRVTGKLVVTIA
jgi:DNA-binding HxlR family transcriptional regulator